MGQESRCVKLQPLWTVWFPEVSLPAPPWLERQRDPQPVRGLLQNDDGVILEYLAQQPHQVLVLIIIQCASSVCQCASDVFL